MEDIISSFQREKDELISINQLLEQEKLDHEMTVKQFEDNIGSSDTKLTELTNELNNLSNQIKNTQENT
jgi:Trp operon repressor